MFEAGKRYKMKILRVVDFGVYLDNHAEGILLPGRFVPQGAKTGDELDVFLYHDSEDRLIATTQTPLGMVGDIVRLKAVSTTPQGAFLHWGLMKDIFVPRSQQRSLMRPQGEYLVKIYLDEKTGRVAATEKFENTLQNTQITVSENEQVNLTVLRRTDIGYLMIINNQHTGVLHFNETFRQIRVGDCISGFIKKIIAKENGEFKIDVVLGERGYGRIEEESEKILTLLKENNGYLPYYDKSDPESIYDFFGMSKKTFKMAIGNLYKAKIITLEKSGIRLV
ncbi:MAG: RNA-binding protein [Ferruginibacter sp.]|nr:RNA-binding protein [Ferruginibacter sp.]